MENTKFYKSEGEEMRDLENRTEQEVAVVRFGDNILSAVKLAPPDLELQNSLLERAKEIIQEGATSNTNRKRGGIKRKQNKITEPTAAGTTIVDRERFQRINRDAFRRKVMKLVDGWIGLLKDGDELKQTVVTNDDQAKTKGPEKKAKRGPEKKMKNIDVEQVRGSCSGVADEMFRQQNGYLYYSIFCTNELESLLASKRQKMEGENEIDVLIDRLAMLANIYIKVMYTFDVRPTVFIKFDDREVPALFARQTVPTPDTCITGPPGNYWTKILHFDNIVKPVQRVPLQRVKSERLLQDVTFVVVGEGALVQLFSIAPNQFFAAQRSRKRFKETYNYIASIPEVDLSRLGWDIIKGTGVVDPIKTFLPKITAADVCSADDEIFTNYMDMFVTMVALRLKNEQLALAHKQVSPKQPRVLRTEYKFETAGRADRPGIFFFRNRNDFVTDISVLSVVDNLFGAEEIASRLDDDDGVYFYDVLSVNEILTLLKTFGILSVQPEQQDFYTYILSFNDDVREAIACSSHTIDYKLEDVIATDTLIGLHETDPARFKPAECLNKVDDIIVTTNMTQYTTTYYVEKGKKLVRILNGYPENLQRSDCVMRVFKLKWRGKDSSEISKSLYTIFPQFSFVFKNMEVYEEIEAGISTDLGSTEIIFPDMRYSLIEVKPDHEFTNGPMDVQVIAGMSPENDILKDLIL